MQSFQEFDNESNLRFNVPLYSGTELSRGMFSLLMARIKNSHGIPNAGMDEIYQLISTVLPEGNEVPKSSFVVKSMIDSMKLDYILIHACPNHCILYRRRHEHATHCPICQTSRFEPNSTRPRKVLRYFPLIPRLLHGYRNPILAKLYKWHKEHEDSEYLGGPRDGKAWSHIQNKYPHKLSDPRSLRLGLAIDGVSPFRNSSTSTPYSVWPVILNTYNLPPWLATNKDYAWLVMLLPGPEQIPQERLDVYLQPLFEELMELWEGVEANDGSASQDEENSTFTLHAILMFTMHDWPGASYCSGLSTSGLHGCFMCHDKVRCTYVKELHKVLYGWHRRFLPDDDEMRQNRTDFWFGELELESAPKCPDGMDWLKRWEDVQERKISIKSSGMRRLAIWWRLPYWKDLLVRHTMDLMHIEANVSRNLLYTLLGMEGKDSRIVRANCKAYGMHQEAWAVEGVRKLPPAPWVLTLREKRTFMERLATMKFPTSYGAGFSRCFKGDWPVGLKSHDLHCLIQHGLPLAIVGLSNENVRSAIYNLSAAFRGLSAKRIKIVDLDVLEVQMATAVCLLEKCFPPSFFVSQVHLLVHLAEEIRCCGPYPARWMYPWERYMGVLKRHARNRKHPEASIAEGHKLNESIFHSNFGTSSFDTWSQKKRLEAHQKLCGIKLQGVGLPFQFANDREKNQAHLYVMRNIAALEDHIRRYDSAHEQWMQARQNWRRQNRHQRFPNRLREFHSLDHWFEQDVNVQGDNDEIVMAISQGLTETPLSYKHIYAFGSHFRTQIYDLTVLGTCDSIVTAKFRQSNVTLLHDGHPVENFLSYVGHITNIISLTYGANLLVVLLRVQWYRPTTEEDADAGFITRPHNNIHPYDKSGFLAINTSADVHMEEEQFVMAEQVTQGFLVPLYTKPGWSLFVPRTHQASDQIEEVSEELL